MVEVPPRRHTFKVRRPKPAPPDEPYSIELGLAISGARLASRYPGRRLKIREIAAFAGCTHQMISKIEKQALRKVRKALGHVTYRQFIDQL